MPNPNRARGAKSRANLRPGTGRHDGLRSDEREVRKLSRKLLLNPKYQQTLKERLENGSLHPSVQVMLWYYAFGKPKDELDIKQPVPIRLVHEYTKTKETE